MAEARGKAEWSRTAAVLALLANIHRDPKKTKAFSAADFSPFEAGRRRKSPNQLPATKKEAWAVFKKAFVRK